MAGERLYREFIQSILSDPQLTQSSQANQISDFFNLDDPDDPDFTVPLENIDLQDIVLQVPKQETLELLKDTLEIMPLFPDDNDRPTKQKPASLSRKESQEFAETCNEPSRSNITSSDQPKTSKEASEEPILITTDERAPITRPDEFVPRINETQRELLNEQMRNHVQMLAQISMFSYCSKEHRHLYDESLNLLNILDCLNKSPQNEGEGGHALVSTDFEIINLPEAITLVESIPGQINTDQLDSQKTRAPARFLELILSSPVFYNTSLIPNFSKLDFQSHFKRSHFSDTEKILLTIGFEKFKHLEKNECCACIHEHVLPHRSCADIKKQIHSISSKESLQMRIKELLKSHKQMNLVSNCQFKPQIHYKSPFYQVEINRVQLPTMYTMAMERLKFSKLQQEVKQIAAVQTPKSKNQRPQVVDNDVIDISHDELDPPSAKKKRNSSPPVSSPVRTGDHTPKTIKPKPNVSPPVLAVKQKSPVVGEATSRQMNPLMVFSQSSASCGQQMSPLGLPAGFGGTIFINPTIHVHMTRNEPDLSQFKDIKPREPKKI